MKQLIKLIAIATIITGSFMGIEREVYAITPIENVYINVQKVFLTNLPYATDGVTLVPIRVVSEEMGASVDWKKPDVYIKRGETEIKLTMDQDVALVNGTEVKLTQAPILDCAREVLIDGEYIGLPGDGEKNIVMVPLRFVGEAFGARVIYNENSGAIHIDIE